MHGSQSQKVVPGPLRNMSAAPEWEMDLGSTRHSGKDLGVGWSERRGWTRRCKDHTGGESRVWALCGKQEEERKGTAGAISVLCSQDDSTDSLPALCVLGHSLRSRRKPGYQHWALYQT